MLKLLDSLNRLVWGVPLLLLILGTGICITVYCKFPQVRLLPTALKAFCGKFVGRNSSDKTSSYRALCTALAATVGTGNLAGVAGAIAIGGPGVVFWMWVCAFFGMATKFAEAVLAIQFRKRNASGESYGGPMYMIRDGLSAKWHWLATVYAFFGVIASFGVGNTTQVNAIFSGIRSAASVFSSTIPFWATALIGIILSILVFRIFSGGARGIGDFTEKLVPVMSAGYIILSAFVMVARAEYIPGALRSIFIGAFSPNAVTGGIVGSFFLTLRVGAARGVFTNEAGMGTAAIAHSTSNVSQPLEQGLMGIVEVFLDTIVICTMTALVILCSGIEIPYGSDIGVELTANAFAAVCGNWVRIPLALALCCFGFATILGWGLYGAACAQFLFGKKIWITFSKMQAIVILVGAVLNTATVWLLSDIVNGLMAVPNLILLVKLYPQVASEVAAYYKRHPSVKTGARY